MPAGLQTHLTLCFYFETSPSLATVKQTFRKLQGCGRFSSLPVPSPKAIFESSWRKVELDISHHCGELKLNSDQELEAEIEKMVRGFPAALLHQPAPELRNGTRGRVERHQREGCAA